MRAGTRVWVGDVTIGLVTRCVEVCVRARVFVAPPDPRAPVKYPKHSYTSYPRGRETKILGKSDTLFPRGARPERRTTLTLPTSVHAFRW